MRTAKSLSLWSFVVLGGLMIATLEREVGERQGGGVLEQLRANAPVVSHLRRRLLTLAASNDFSSKEQVWFLRSIPASQSGAFTSPKNQELSGADKGNPPTGGGSSSTTTSSSKGVSGGTFVEEVSTTTATSSSSSSWVCPYDGLALRDPIVVVGTDGSGTRVVAKLLALLNVTVLVERGVYGQMDVDGRVAKVHFTSPIQHVLASAGSPDYALLPAGVRGGGGPVLASSAATVPPPPNQQQPPTPMLLQGVVAEEARSLIRTFANTMRANACAAAAAAAKPVSPSSSSSPSSSFAWAFKKPDLMNLLPLLLEAFPNMQVLHVVRDGRDMAFSHNHAPLRKYAPHIKSLSRTHDAKEDEREHEEGGGEAMQQLRVWALQNMAVLQWGNRANREKNGNNALGDLYRWVRTEDFGASSVERIALFASAIQALVGAARGVTAAPFSVEAVAEVMGQLRGASLGSFDPNAVHKAQAELQQKLQLQHEQQASSTSANAASGGSGNNGGAVSSQYGKWRTLATASEQAALTKAGETALQAFGYDVTATTGAATDG